MRNVNHIWLKINFFFVQNKYYHWAVESNFKYIFAARDKNTAREDADVDFFFYLLTSCLNFLPKLAKRVGICCSSKGDVCCSTCVCVCACVRKFVNMSSTENSTAHAGVREWRWYIQICLLCRYMWYLRVNEQYKQAKFTRTIPHKLSAPNYACRDKNVKGCLTCTEPQCSH